jgi:hypothetical protein
MDMLMCLIRKYISPFEHVNEPFSIKDRKFLDYLSNLLYSKRNLLLGIS